jgi:hypothetical protein
VAPAPHLVPDATVADPAFAFGGDAVRLLIPARTGFLEIDLPPPRSRA